MPKGDPSRMRAVQMEERAAFDGEADIAAEGVLLREWRRMQSSLDHRLLVIDRQCRVLEQSAAVVRTLVPPLPIVVDGGFLRPRTRDAERRLHAFLETLDESPRRRMIAGEGGENWVLMRGWRVGGRADGAAFLHFLTSHPLRPLAQTALPDQFGLTQAETVVLEKIAALKTPATIARELGISNSTVRSHLKQLHNKLEVDSGRQLVVKARAFSDG